MVMILLAVPLACNPVAFFGRLGRINEATGNTQRRPVTVCLISTTYVGSKLSGRVLKFKLPVASRGPVTLFFLV